ncbi:MAG: ParB/RepB/Spo0J family partition protein [Candidatus Komeilibacteria bacterium]
MANNSLGRGLGSLIPSRATNDEKTNIEASADQSGKVGELRHVPTNKVKKNPYQARQEFKHDELEQLADSIKKHGILEPLLVTQEGDYYQLIAGERRWQAATLLNLPTVPVIVKDADELGKMEISLIENVQRENLNPIEEAQAYKRLLEEFSMTQEQVAQRVNKNRSTVANSLRLLQLPADIQTALRSGTISRSQAKLILSVADTKQQIKLFKKVIKNSLTVRQTHHAVSSLSGKERIASDNIELSELADELRHHLGTKVAMMGSASRGKVVIEYYSAAERQALISKLLGKN